MSHSIFAGRGRAMAQSRRLFLEHLESRTLLAVVAEFPLATAASLPDDIARGADGNFWFTEFGSNRIGRVTPAGVITEFSLAGLQAGSEPLNIVSDPNNNLLYFTELGAGRIGTINPLAAGDALIPRSETQS